MNSQSLVTCTPFAARRLMSGRVLLLCPVSLLDSLLPTAPASVAVLAVRLETDGILRVEAPEDVGNPPEAFAFAGVPAAPVVLALSSTEKDGVAVATKSWLSGMAGRPNAATLGVVVDAAPERLALGVTLALCTALGKQHETASGLVLQLSNELSSLRLEHESTLEALRASHNRLAQAGELDAVCSTVVRLGEPPVLVGPAEPNAALEYVITQPLNRSALGLAALDVYALPGDTSRGGEGRLLVSLVSHDRWLELARWEVAYPRTPTWVFLPLQEVLSSPDVYLSLVFRWVHVSGIPAKLAARRSEQFLDGFATRNGEEIPGTHLTHRLWSGVPRTPCRYVGADAFRSCTASVDFAVRSPGEAKIISYRRQPEDIAIARTKANQTTISGTLIGYFGVYLVQSLRWAAVECDRAALELVVDAPLERPIRCQLVVAADPVTWHRGGRDQVVIDSSVAASDWVVLRSEGKCTLSCNFPAGTFDSTKSGSLILHVFAEDLEATVPKLSLTLGVPAFRWRATEASLTKQAIARLPAYIDPHSDSMAKLVKIRERARIQRECGEKHHRSASLLCPIHRACDIPVLMSSVNQQLHEPLEAVIVLNSDSLSEEDFARYVLPNRRYQFLRVPEAENLGACLNAAFRASTGDVVFKIDADDYYFANYVGDQIAHLEATGADIVGKSCGFIYRQEVDEIFVRWPTKEQTFVDQTFGGTIACSRAVIDESPFREDTRMGTDLAFFQDCKAAGRSVYSTDRFNYLYVRRDSPALHTWDVSAEALLGPDPLQVGRWTDRGTLVR